MVRTIIVSITRPRTQKDGRENLRETGLGLGLDRTVAYCKRFGFIMSGGNFDTKVLVDALATLRNPDGTSQESNRKLA